MMQRRAFSASAAAMAAASALPLAAQAQGGIREGKDYVRLPKPAPTDAPAGMVDVVEFFWYSCPHCNTFEPTLAAWKKTAPKQVSLRRVPVAFNTSFVPQQKIYYALEGMGKVDEFHTTVFRAVHVDRVKLSKDEEIFEWVAKQKGLDANKFKEVYNSFNVANQVRRATQLQEAYGVEGVPAMGVAGLYYTDGTRAGSMQAVLKVVEQLVETARKG